MACKCFIAFPTITKCLPLQLVISIWVLDNLFIVTTGYQVPLDHVLTICQLLCQLPQKFKRGGCKLCHLPRGLPLGAGWKSTLLKDFSSMPEILWQELFQPAPRDVREWKSKQYFMLLSGEAVLRYEEQDASGPEKPSQIVRISPHSGAENFAWVLCLVSQSLLQPRGTLHSLIWDFT